MKAKNQRMREEYDFADGDRGKYAERFRDGSNLVLLDPDVARSFPDSDSVNAALRKLLEEPKRTKRRKG